MSSSKKADSKSGSKAGSKSGSKSGRTNKGKLIYHSVEESKKRVGENPIDIVEKSVTHSDENLFCKYYEKKNGTVTKVTVKASGTGKEYTYSVKKGDAPIETQVFAKKDLVSKLKKDDKLEFMVKYIENASSLARPKKSKTASKSKSKSKSKTQKSVGRPKKVTKAKSKSKSKSKGKKVAKK